MIAVLPSSAGPQAMHSGLLQSPPAANANQNVKQSLVDQVNQAFGDLREAKGKEIETLTRKQNTHQAKVEDLLALQTALDAEVMRQSGKDGSTSVDLSKINMNLSADSPMGAATGKTQASLKDVMEYYGRHEKALNLPVVPSTVSELRSVTNSVQQIVIILLSPVSQREWVKLQDMVSSLNAMTKLQSSLVAKILSMNSKIVSSM